MNTVNKFECHVCIKDDNSSILPQLNQACSLSNADIKQAIAKGALWLTRSGSTQRIRRIKKPLKNNDELHFYYNSEVLSQRAEQAILIADFNDYSVWYKPYGMLSQGSKWSDHCTINRVVQLSLKPERPVFIVHRLDRAASGLMLLAHSKHAARALSLMFEQHQLEKHYQIIVHGNHQLRPQPDIIELAIDNKSAKSIMNTIEYQADADISLVDVKIESGRKHQIRKHAASINLPVVGDRLHGSKQYTYPDNLNLQLCSVSLRFNCPISGEERSFQCDPSLSPNIANIALSLIQLRQTSSNN
ncbi:RluA family pseudouridine synthase [Colwelliaceae bacterium 6471]